MIPSQSLFQTVEKGLPTTIIFITHPAFTLIYLEETQLMERLLIQLPKQLTSIFSMDHNLGVALSPFHKG
jgi:hypothetical protein